MDIKKLERAIVDGLEDVKAQDILVFDTERLSPLFERVIIASGTSNRQTKALASSVRDAVKGRGMPVLRTKDFGDLYVQLDVETPQSLSKRQRELLEEFERESTRENSPTSEGFFAKLKSIFEN